MSKESIEKKEKFNEKDIEQIFGGSFVLARNRDGDKKGELKQMEQAVSDNLS